MINVRLFASLKERAGVESFAIAVPEAATVEAAVQAVIALHPVLGERSAELLVAVNRRYVRRDDPIGAGDELALMPPVSGG